MPRRIFGVALAATALALTAAQADAAVVPGIQDRTLTVTGDAAADAITLRVPTTAPTTLEVDLGDDGSADFRFARSAFDTVRVVAGAGDDRVRIVDATVRVPINVPTTILGGAGADTLIGGRSAETLLAGDGDDKVTGGGGADVVDLGAGSDRADWGPADGNDDVDGGAGFDSLVASGTDADDNLAFSAAGPVAHLSNGTASLGAQAVERMDVDVRSGADVVNVRDLAGTGVQEVRPNLSLGLTDAGADQVLVDGAAADDQIDLLPQGLGRVAILGARAFVDVTHADPARDRITVRGAGGRDRLGAGGSELAAQVTLDGGDGDDQLTGSAGADTLLGGPGNDFASGRRGDDDLRLGDGNDTVEARVGDGSDFADGAAGFDRVRITGSSAKEKFTAAGDGFSVNGVKLVRPAGVEGVDMLSFGGADTIAVPDLSGTGITDVNASLFDFGVPGGNFDQVTVDGTAGDDKVKVAGGPVITGLPAKVTVTGTAANDTLVIDGKAGNDTIESTTLPAAGIRMQGSGSAGDDVLLGGAGDDVFVGGDDDDVIFAGGGDNVAIGGAGNDVLRGEEGDDVLDGGAGDDILIGNAGDDVLLNGEVVFDN